MKNKLNKNLVFVTIVITASLLYGATKMASIVMTGSTIDSTVIGGNASAKGTFSYINGIIQADQYAGADACAKIRAASLFAISAGAHEVDATHFVGTQACASDPVGALVTPLAAAANLTINFGATHFTSTVQWTITNSLLTLRGKGPGQTIVEYTGTTGNPITAVLWAHAQLSGVTAGLEDDSIENMTFYGNTISSVATVTDGLLLSDFNRSNVTNVIIWGVSNCGIHSQGDVTTTWYRPKVSNAEATILGIASGHPQPAQGICLDSSPYSGNQTTDGTVVDAAAEGVSGTGWSLPSANSMTFTSGTSENNGSGVNVAIASRNNMFLASDFEGNSSYDVQDNGKSTIWRNIIATDHVGTGGVTLNGDWISWEGGSLTSLQVTNNTNDNRIWSQGNTTDTPEIFHKNLAGAANIFGNGSNFFQGGIAGFDAGLGGEIDLFTQFFGASQDVGIFRNTSGGYVEDAFIGQSSQFFGTVQATGFLGNATTATALATAPTTCGSNTGNWAYGIAANGNALCIGPVYAQQVGSIASTGAGGLSVTTQTIPLLQNGLAFTMPDTNYIASCSMIQQTGFPYIYGITKFTTGIQINFSNGSSGQAVVSTAAEIDCTISGR